MNRYPVSRLGAVALALLLNILACNYPVATQIPSPEISIPTHQPDQASPRLTLMPSTTPLQSSAPISTPQPAAHTPRPNYQPVFEPVSCAFPVPPGTNPQCGVLVVPESRTNPHGNMIRLHVAVFHSRSANPAPDPVVHLSGGPGSSALGLAGYMFRQGLGEVLANRDLILFDPRGAGYSTPTLTCPERSAITPKLLDGSLTSAEKERAIVDAFQRCRDRLTSQGIDLSAYTSAAIAADVDDLRRALGYARINLYGVSYGTRVALTMMRDHPQAVRSVALDSTLPLQVNLYTSLAPNAERAFNLLFERCTVDPGCWATYPDLKRVFYDLVDRLNAAPISVAVSADGASYTVHVDGDRLIDVLFVGMYNPSSIAIMPEMIYDLRQGNTAILESYLELYFDASTALGMQMSLICAEELPFSPPEEAYTLAQGVQPQIAAFFPASVQPLYSACESWGAATPDPVENQPVASDIPTLALAGEFDPITPPDWGRLAAESLSQSYFYQFPANGHWVTRSSPCALSIMAAFFDHPAAAPVDDCIESIPGVNFTR
jgi:pimeloyl-ACP methyl ester carboxylesterase